MVREQVAARTYCKSVQVCCGTCTAMPLPRSNIQGVPGFDTEGARRGANTTFQRKALLSEHLSGKELSDPIEADEVVNSMNQSNLNEHHFQAQTKHSPSKAVGWKLSLIDISTPASSSTWCAGLCNLGLGCCTTLRKLRLSLTALMLLVMLTGHASLCFCLSRCCSFLYYVT